MDLTRHYIPLRIMAELGLDTRAVRDALADDLARRCPDREAPADRR